TVQSAPGRGRYWPLEPAMLSRGGLGRVLGCEIDLYARCCQRLADACRWRNMESSLRRTKREQHGRFVPKPGSRNSRSNLPRDAVYGGQYPGLSILPVAKSQTLCTA